MEAITQIETFYVLRLTRLEAVRVLVEPKAVEEAQNAIRNLLQPGDEAEQAPTIGALLGSGNDKRRMLPAPSATVKKAMRKMRAALKRKPCPHCGKPFKRLGLHLVKAHPDGHRSQRMEIIERGITPVSEGAQ